MDVFEGNGIYWRCWDIPVKGKQEKVDKSSWVLVKDVDDEHFTYRLIKIKEYKFWLGEIRVVDKSRFIKQLYRKATYQEENQIWQSIKAPVASGPDRNIQGLVAHVCGEVVNGG